MIAQDCGERGVSAAELLGCVAVRDPFTWDKVMAWWGECMQGAHEKVERNLRIFRGMTNTLARCSRKAAEEAQAGADQVSQRAAILVDMLIDAVPALAGVDAHMDVAIKVIAAGMEPVAGVAKGLKFACQKVSNVSRSLAPARIGKMKADLRGHRL